MNFENLYQQLEQNAERIKFLIKGVTEEQARWKPTPEDWSVLEVINHLYDEEQFDFRVRLKILINQTGEDWPPINPAGWVTEKKYNERDLQESLNNYLNERKKSLAWLTSQKTANWQASATAPWGGQLHAGDMLTAWTAHDLHHMRQLVELHYAWVNRQGEPYSPAYAGDW